MNLTEEIIKNLPVLTEEMKEISLTKEELTEKAIREFNEEADRIDNELPEIPTLPTLYSSTTTILS